MYLAPSNLDRQCSLTRLALNGYAKLGKRLQQLCIWTATKRLWVGCGKSDVFMRNSTNSQEETQHSPSISNIDHYIWQSSQNSSGTSDRENLTSINMLFSLNLRS